MIDDLPPTARAALAVSRSVDLPTVSDKVAVRAALEARLGARAFSQTTPTAPGVGAWSTTGLLVATAVLAVITLGALARHLSARKPSLQTRAMHLGVMAPRRADVRPPEPAAVESALEPTPVRRTPEGRDTRATTRGAPVRWEREAEVLRLSRESLAIGDTRAALTTLDAYRARQPGGVGSPRLECARMIVRCRRGEAEASEVERFVRLHGDVPLIGRVRDACRVGTAGVR